jgi:hypothetical protein
LPLKFVFLNQVVYPVLEWLLSRIDDLKKRAYLAKFLVKVEIPPEVVADPDLSDMYDQVTVVSNTVGNYTLRRVIFKLYLIINQLTGQYFFLATLRFNEKKLVF